MFVGLRRWAAELRDWQTQQGNDNGMAEALEGAGR
jgi:hypothetical protein